MISSSVLLPALFGLLGTIVGGILTIWGQVWAERRAQERRSEDHYAEFATELNRWLRDRSKLSSEAAALSGQASREKASRLANQFPVSDFVMRASTAFPEVADDLNAWARHEMEMMKFLSEIADEQHPFGRFDVKQRRAMVERGVVLERPILAVLASARAQVTMNRPKRLSSDRLVKAAEKQREFVRIWNEKNS
jgi:hypothetical protein